MDNSNMNQMLLDMHRTNIARYSLKTKFDADFIKSRTSSSKQIIDVDKSTDKNLNKDDHK